MASSSRAPLTCVRCIRSSWSAAQPATGAASSSRHPSAAFSSSAPTSYAASTPEDATASKPPHTAAAEGPEPSSSMNAIGRGRRSAGRGRPQMLPPFPEWMARGADQFKRPKPGMGPNWIGDTSVKNEIWRLHVSNPKHWTVPALSEKFNVGKERMHAVLRLKALESEWTAQKKPLQTEFQKNMDRLLGSKDKRDAETPPAVQSPDTSTRGPQYEEFSDAAATTASKVERALADSSAKRKAMIESTPSGGPDLQARLAERTVSSTALGGGGSGGRDKSTGRAKLLVVEVGGDSYKGAGRADRNAKRAERRKLLRKRARQAKKDKFRILLRERERVAGVEAGAKGEMVGSTAGKGALVGGLSAVGRERDNKGQGKGQGKAKASATRTAGGGAAGRT